jgi:hypothetical protein
MEILNFLTQNWDVIGLIITNLVAYLIPSPKQRKGEIL